MQTHDERQEVKMLYEELSATEGVYRNHGDEDPATNYGAWVGYVDETFVILFTKNLAWVEEDTDHPYPGHQYVQQARFSWYDIVHSDGSWGAPFKKHLDEYRLYAEKPEEAVRDGWLEKYITFVGWHYVSPYTLEVDRLRMASYNTVLDYLGVSPRDY